MQYEVELKFPAADLPDIRDRLSQLGATITGPRLETDLYFAHPARDFRKTDEALRIRSRAEQNFVTYKGPKIDATTKTRREIELPVQPGPEAAEAWVALLETLGFTLAGEVRKSRLKAAVVWQGREVEGSLDDVQGLGTFVELELMVPAEGIEAAKDCIQSLARALGLKDSERRSYLELLTM